MEKSDYQYCKHGISIRDRLVPVCQEQRHQLSGTAGALYRAHREIQFADKCGCLHGPGTGK